MHTTGGSGSMNPEYKHCGRVGGCVSGDQSCYRISEPPMSPFVRDLRENGNSLFYGIFPDIRGRQHESLWSGESGLVSYDGFSLICESLTSRGDGMDFFPIKAPSVSYLSYLGYFRSLVTRSSNVSGLQQLFPLMSVDEYFRVG